MPYFLIGNFMEMHYIRRGAGKPLLLIHGIGGSWRSWELIIDGLAAAGREVIVVDLPGHGATPPLTGAVTIYTLADAVTAFLKNHHLLGIDAVGSSMGARLVLELVRRGGVLGAVVSLDPGGFWRRWEIPFFYYSIAASVRLLRLLQPIIPLFTGNAIGRTVLLPQFSARPWHLPASLVFHEMRTFATSPSFDELLYHLAYGQRQQGTAPGAVKAPLVIGWGRQDRVCFPHQARRALTAFPDAHLYWFEHCGHFPQWDAPAKTVNLILAVTNNNFPATDLPDAGTKSTSFGKKLVRVGFGLVLVAGGIWLFRRKA